VSQRTELTGLLTKSFAPFSFFRVEAARFASGWRRSHSVRNLGEKRPDMRGDQGRRREPRRQQRL
jgi:hypothetical protein